MKIAITGATGFIGRHVRNALAKTDHEVILVVRSRESAGETSAHETLVTADLHQERTDWFELFGKPDAVLHLAWGGLPNYTDEYHVKVELPMQSTFLSTLIDSGLKKLVVTGTCYEYGMSSGALSEDAKTNPNTSYGIAKDCLRKELFELQQRKNFDLTWARIFYPYGEGQSEKSLYSQLKICANSGIRSFEIYNSDSKLDFVPVETVASSLLKLLGQRGFGVINIGSGEPRSVGNLVRDIIVENHWDISPQVTQNKARDFESKAFWADLAKIQSLSI